MKKLFFILLFAISARCAAQSPAYSYDKEKTYTQTDHVFYTPGETIFFKTWLVRGSENKPSTLSNILYVEILGPSGSMLERQTYRAENGYSEGSYTLSEQAAGVRIKLAQLPEHKDPISGRVRYRVCTSPSFAVLRSSSGIVMKHGKED